MKTNHVGNIIRNRREQLELTMVQVSEKSGIAQSSLSLIENGQRNPSQKTLAKIAEVLEIDLEELNENSDSNEIVNVNEGKMRVIKDAKIEFQISDDIRILVEINALKIGSIDDPDKIINKINNQMYDLKSSTAIDTITKFFDIHKNEIDDIIHENINNNLQKMMEILENAKSKFK